MSENESLERYLHYRSCGYLHDPALEMLYDEMLMKWSITLANDCHGVSGDSGD